MYITVRRTGFQIDTSLHIIEGVESKITSGTGQVNDYTILDVTQNPVGNNDKAMVVKQTEQIISHS